MLLLELVEYLLYGFLPRLSILGGGGVPVPEYGGPDLSLRLPQFTEECAHTVPYQRNKNKTEFVCDDSKGKYSLAQNM